MVLKVGELFISLICCCCRLFNGEEKCDVTNVHICESMEMVVIFRKNKMNKVALPKISLLVQIGGEI